MCSRRAYVSLVITAYEVACGGGFVVLRQVEHRVVLSQQEGRKTQEAAEMSLCEKERER